MPHERSIHRFSGSLTTYRLIGVDLYPLPNGADFGDGTAQLFSNPKRPVDEDYTMGRVDHNFSNADSFFVRYTFSRAILSNVTQYPTLAVDALTRSQYVTLGETRIFSPRVLNTVRLGFNRSYSNQFGRPLFDVKPDLLFVPGQQLGLITFRGIGITEYGAGQGYFAAHGSKGEPRTHRGEWCGAGPGHARGNLGRQTD